MPTFKHPAVQRFPGRHPQARGLSWKFKRKLILFALASIFLVGLLAIVYQLYFSRRSTSTASRLALIPPQDGICGPRQSEVLPCRGLPSSRYEPEFYKKISGFDSAAMKTSSLVHALRDSFSKMYPSEHKKTLQELLSTNALSAEGFETLLDTVDPERKATPLLVNNETPGLFNTKKLQYIANHYPNFTIKLINNNTLLHKAIANERWEAASVIVNAWGNKIDFRITAYDDKNTALMLSILTFNPKLSEVILNREDNPTAKASVHVVDRQGRSPLHMAFLLGQAETAQLLLDKGADINLRDSYGKTPIDYLDSPDLAVRYVLENIGISPDRACNARRNLLLGCAMESHELIMPFDSLIPKPVAADLKIKAGPFTDSMRRMFSEREQVAPLATLDNARKLAKVSLPATYADIPATVAQAIKELSPKSVLDVVHGGRAVLRQRWKHDNSFDDRPGVAPSL